MGKSGWDQGNILYPIKDKISDIIKYILLVIVFFVMSSSIGNRADDNVFADGIRRFGSITNWGRWYTENWGGRVIPHGLLVLVLQLPSFIFNLLNTLSWILLVIYSQKIFGSENKQKNTYFPFILSGMIFFFIPVAITKEAIFWKCANVLYLWGMASLFIAVYPFVLKYINKDVKVIDYILSCIAIIYTASFEQAAVLMCGIIIGLYLYILISTRKINGTLLLEMLFAIVATFFFCFMLKGNAVRSDTEVFCHMSDYGIFSLVDKILWGLTYTIENLESELFIVIILLCVCLYAGNYKNRKNNKIAYAFSIILCLYFLFSLLSTIIANNSHGGHSFITKLFFMVQVDSTQIGWRLITYLVTGVHIFMYFMLGILLLVTTSKENEYDFLSFLIYFGAMGSSFIMAFSPTIYASLGRPRFICYFLLICILIKKMNLGDGVRGSF